MHGVCSNRWPPHALYKICVHICMYKYVDVRSEAVFMRFAAIIGLLMLCAYLCVCVCTYVCRGMWMFDLKLCAWGLPQPLASSCSVHICVCIYICVCGYMWGVFMRVISIVFVATSSRMYIRLCVCMCMCACIYG
jgi:hypothetical protein